MRIWSFLRWRALALARACGYRGNPRLFGVEVPLALVPSLIILGRLDALVAAGFDLLARRGQVSVLRRRAA